MTIAETTLNSGDINKSLVWNTDKELLLDLDEKRYQLNRRLAMLEDQLEEKTPSPVTGRSIKRRSGDIISLLTQVTPDTNFESILIEDIVRNCIAASTYASFIFDKRPTKFTRSGKHFSVATFLRNFYGLVPRESPYNILLRVARNHEHKDIHRYYELTYSMQSESKDVYLKGELASLEERVLPRIKQVMLDFAKEMKVPEEKLKGFEVYLDQIGTGYAYFDSIHNIASLDPSKILLYKDKDGKEKIFEGISMVEAAHEKVHGLHSIFSESSFPRIIGLHGESDSYNSLNMGLSEGIARRTERYSIPFFFRKHKEELGLVNKDLEIMARHSQFHLIRRHYQTLFTVLTVMQNTESLNGFDRYKKLAEITGIPYFNRDHYLMDDLPIAGSTYFISSILGSQYIKKCMQETNEKYGREVVDNNMGIILRGFMTGNWQFQPHYRFFNEEYLPRLESIGILPKPISKPIIPEETVSE